MRDLLRRHRADLIVVILLLAIGLSALVMSLTLSPDGEYIKITRDNEVIATLPLDEDKELSVDGVNTVVIEDGYAYMKDALCPDGLCVKMGKIHSVGERIICLPNRVIVEVVRDGS